ncbi:MAG: DNA-processing protein DprA [Paludibacteraceae bacterium]
MIPDTLRYQIGLTLLNGIGPVNARNLVAYLGSPEAVFRERPETLRKIQGIGDCLADNITHQQVLARADEEVEFVVKYGIDTHFFTDTTYPYRLKECADAPVLIYSKGTIDFNSGRFLAVVGTRKLTPYGKDLCQSIVRDLAQMQPDLTIVSGLAYGADVAAHKAALDNGLRTFGVVAHGLDRIYPSANRVVAQKMIEQGGAVLTEYTSKTEPLAPNFVARNRIVAGLCDAVLVVESALKGGSLITAELANDYDRDVFAIPGRATDVQSQGCNQLIYKNQAVLVQSADDLANFMCWNTQPLPRERQQELFAALTADEQAIVDVLRTDDAVYINHLAQRSGIPLQKVLGLLVQMEFKGLVQALPGSHYKMML